MFFQFSNSLWFPYDVSSHVKFSSWIALSSPSFLTHSLSHNLNANNFNWTQTELAFSSNNVTFIRSFPLCLTSNISECLPAAFTQESQSSLRSRSSECFTHFAFYILRACRYICCLPCVFITRIAFIPERERRVEWALLKKKHISSPLVQFIKYLYNFFILFISGIMACNKEQNELNWTCQSWARVYFCVNKKLNNQESAIHRL